MPPALSDTRLDIVKTMLTGKFDEGNIADAAGYRLAIFARLKRSRKTFTHSA